MHQSIKVQEKKKKWKILACAYFHQICVQHQTLSFSFKDNCLPFTISLRTVHRRKDTQSIKVISQLHQTIKVQKYGKYYHTCIAVKYESGTNICHFLRIQVSQFIFQESMAIMKFRKRQTTKHKYIYPKPKTTNRAARGENRSGRPTGAYDLIYIKYSLNWVPIYNIIFWIKLIFFLKLSYLITRYCSITSIPIIK